MRQSLQRAIGVVWWALVCVAALLAMTVVAVKLLLPCLDDYRLQIESNLSQLTGYQVTLSKIGGHLEGVDPTVSVSNLVLTVNGESAVSIPEIRVRIDLIKSLLSLTPQFTYVRFVKPSLSFQESGGQWRLKGAVSSSNVKSDVGVERILGYLTAQQRFSILNAKIDINSEQYGKHAIAIPAAYVFQYSQSSWIKSKVYVDGNATPFDLNAKIYQSLGAFGDYQVDASVNVPNILIPFNGKSETWSADLTSADFAGKLWLNYRVGEGFMLQAKASKLSVAFKNGEAYESAPSVRVGYSQKKASLSVDVHHMQLKDEHEKTYEPMNLSYEWSTATNQSYLLFNQFDLALAHRIANHFLQPDWHITKLISGLSPKGVISNASLRIGKKDNAVSYHFLSNLQNVSSSGYLGIPKADHIDAVLSIADTGGYIQFKQHKGVIAFPDLYANEWQVSSLSGTVNWQLVQNTLVVRGQDLKLKRNGSDIKGGFRFEARQNAPDWLSLNIAAQHVPVADRLTYLPDKALDAGLRSWIKDSFANKGEVNNVDLLIQSDLADGAVPDVRLKMDVSDADITFDKNWPTAKSVNGQFTLNESGVHVLVKSASLSDVAVSNISVDVPVKNGKADWLSVKGSVAQESSEMLRLLQSTPLANNVLAPFKTWRVSGVMAGDFNVSIPLNEKHKEPRVSLGLRFKNNPVYIGDIDLNNVVDKGQFNFSSEKGIYDSDFDIQSFAGHTHMVLTSSFEKDGRISILGQLSGSANLYQIAQWRKLPDYLANKITGDVKYNGTLSINKSQEGQVDLLINSDLKGGAIALPQPFSKVSAQAMPFTFKMMSHQQDIVIQSDFSSLVKTNLLIKSGQFIGGELYFNSDKPLPSNMKKGLAVEGQFSSFDVSDWSNVFEKLGGEEGSVPSLNDSNIKLPDWLRYVNLLIDKIVVNPQNSLHNVKVNYDANNTNGKFQVSSDELNFKFDHDGLKPRLHFGYLSWNTDKDAGDGSPDKPPFHASQVPNIILIVDQLYINQKPYGDWNLNVVRNGNELRIDPFSSVLKKGKFDGHLIWKDNAAQPTVTLTISVNGKDLAELIDKFSDKAFVTSKKYKINVVLNWQGHPFYFNRKTVSGRISFDAEDGNFSQVDELPAFMKIFGIFNVESLKRRLSLDFSDVYKPGLTYDSFKGTFDINKGILKTTKPLSISSPTAEVSLEGTADIVNEALDETLTATLPITRSLPLAGLLWGSPQLAGILFLTDKLIGDSLSKVTSVQYHIKGSFDSPEITPVKHKQVKKVSN